VLRAPLRPVHRVASVATVTLSILGMGVLGTSAAVADDLPADVVPPVAAAPGVEDAAPAGAASPAAGTVEVEVEAEVEPTVAPAPASLVDEAQGAGAAPDLPAAEDDVVGIAAATEPGTAAISGTTGIGDLQTVVTGGWPESTTFAYRWTRDGKAVEGATGETYVLVSADAGRVVEVVVTGTGPAADDEPTTVTSQRGVAAGTPPVFTSQPGTELVAVAGQPFSFTWEATGDPVPDIAIVASPGTPAVRLPEDADVTRGPGSLTVSGTSTLAASYSFAVTPLSAVAPGALLDVRLEVAPAQTVGLSALVGVYDAAAGSASVWRGDVDQARYVAGDEQVETLVVTEGSALAVTTYEQDAFENVTRAGSPAELPLVSSSVAADRVGTTGRESIIASSVTFTGTGPRTITVARGGLTITIPVEVRSAAAVPGTVTAGTPSGAEAQLAHTGGDLTGGLLTLAAGLLAAGTALTVTRLRRRVQH